MSQYLLLLHDDPNGSTERSPEEMQSVVQEYGVWAQGLAAEGKLVAGEKLTAEGGRIVEPRGERVAVTDGPYAETKEVIGGFFIVEADSYDDAVAVAKTCPHMRYGLRTTVRRIEQTTG